MSLTIQTKNLVKIYGSRTVVNNVSFNVHQGEIVGLLGPNGAGKTTSFYQVVGLIKPDEGEVFLNDINITKLPMYKRAQMGIGYLPQEASVFRKLSVEDNISAVLEMTKLSKAEQKAKLESLLDEFRLQRVRKNNGDTLSGGERRRTEIARALAVDPKFILLDEPFAGVDPIAVEDIQAIVAKLKFKNIGILITDHNVNETLSICDRAYLLIDGKIFEHGTAEELAGNEQVRRLYLGRNFELKRKDYLHDEVRDADRISKITVTPEKIAYSVESAVQMIDAILKTPVTAVNVQSISGDDVLHIKDLFHFIDELKPAILDYNTTAHLPKVTELCNKIPVLETGNYKPGGWATLLSYFGSAVSTVSYYKASVKLEEDLQITKSYFANIKLIIDNPAFAEAITL
ncbi:MAG: LPS export ABC transporter ATP-binding protein [Ferruginibacter sp.]